jgi:hypothetical protein
MKVRLGAANQSRPLGTVAYTCSQCGRHEGAYATLYWRVRRAAGIPLVSAHVATRYRCVACDAETTGRPPAGVAPPFAHRFGALIAIAVVLAIGAIAVKLAMPDPQPQVSQAAQAELDALRGRVSKAGLVEVTADIECKKTLDAAIARAVPDLWKAKPVAPSEPIAADALPVLVGDRKDVAPERLPKRACKHQTPNAPFLFVAAGDDEAKRLGELTAKVEAYEAEIATLVPPERFVVVDAECLEAPCNARAALVTRDGQLLALSATKLRTLGVAIEAWAQQQP